MNPRQLASIWSEWTRAAQALLSILDEQAEVLTRRDHTRVEELQPLVEDRRQTLREVDDRAHADSRLLAESLGVRPGLETIARRAAPEDAVALRRLARDVTGLATRLREAMLRNHALIENELAYVAGTLTLIGRALREPPTPYGKAKTGALTLDRKV